MGVGTISKYVNIISQLSTREYGGSDKYYMKLEATGPKIPPSVIKDINQFGVTSSDDFIGCTSVTFPEAQMKTSSVEILGTLDLSFEFPVYYGMPGEIVVEMYDDDKHSAYKAIRNWFKSCDTFTDSAAISPMKLADFSGVLTLFIYNKMGDWQEETKVTVFPKELPSRSFSYGTSDINSLSLTFFILDKTQII